jgi:recombination protein RecT
MTDALQKQPESPVAMLLNDPMFKKQIALALPRHMTPDRMARIALTEVRKNPKLLQADKLSFAGAIMACAQLGLEPGNGLGHAYLIPFWNSKAKCFEVQMIPGYKGLIDLARRSGQIESISARIVREKDYFEFEYGDDERIRHKPFEGPEDEAGRITHVYAIARLKGGGIQREVLTRQQIERIKDRKKADNPVWDTDFDEMARKTAVRRICKYLPMSPELARAIDLDNKVYDGESQDSHKNFGFIEAEYEPRPTLSADATTVAEISEQETQQSAEKTATELRTEFLKKFTELTRKAAPLDLWKHMGFDGSQNIVNFEAPRLTAMIDMLKTFRAPA